MTDPTQGWIKLWRKLLHSPEWLGLSPSGKCVLIALLLRANWEMFGIIELSEREIAESAEVSRGSVRRALIHLQKTGFIRRAAQQPAQQRAQQVAAYCIMKFEEYQSNENEQAHPSGPQPGPVSIYKKEEEYTSVASSKKGKGQKKQPHPPKIYDQEAHEIAKLWMEGLPSYTEEGGEKLRTRVLPRWLDALDKLHRLDGHAWQDICHLVQWILRDTGDGNWPGWCTVCQSPIKLRKSNKEGVPYFVSISQRMKNGSRSEQQQSPAYGVWPEFPPE